MRNACRSLLFALALFLLSVTAAYSQTALQFVAMTPCRLLDTRTGSPILGGQPLTITVQGSCGVPASAQAYSFNVTVVPRGLLDYLTLWPTGQNQPVVSTMNSYDGRIKAVAAIIPAGTGGAIDAYATNTTDLILDINGYFLSSANSTLAFYPLTPCRLYDTRGGNYLQAQQTVNFAMQNACGIPASAQAYSLNFTALPLRGYLNYLTAWPTGQQQPYTSTLNAPTGTVTANAALVQGGTDGQISVFAYNDTDLVIDTNGYFAPPGASGQLALYTLEPCRVLDTRPDYFQGQRTVQVESSGCSVPSAAQAYIVNATVLPQGFFGYLTLWGSGNQPTVSTLNAYDGAVTSNLAIVPANTADGTLQAFASDSAQLLIDIFSYMGLAPLSITTTSLPGGTTGQPYQAQLAASGGAPPYIWGVSSGDLPPGLTLAGSTGAITGIPTSAGNFSFTVQVADSQHNTATQALSIMISVGPLTIITAQLPNGTQGVAYSATLGAAGGVPPYTWSIASGSLPAGLMLSSGSGLISGTPTASGTSPFIAQVTDAQMNTAEAMLQIVVNPAITNALLNGHYAFALNGFQSGAPFIMASAFFADGQGNISVGALDVNYGQGEPNDPSQCRSNPICPIAEVIQSPGSVYDLSTGNGLGTLTLATVDHSGNPHTYQFSIAVSGSACTPGPSSSACGRIILRDPSNPETYGAGVLKAQDSQYFSTDRFFPVNLAVVLNGVDPSGNRYAGAGVLATNPGTLVDIDCSGNGWGLSGCPLDINDNGTPAADPVNHGQFSADIDPTIGRGAFVNMQFPNDRSLCTGQFPDCGYAYYIVNQQEMVLISSDPLSRPANLTLWTAVRQSQSAGWNLGALSGVDVMQLSAVDPNGSEADIAAGLLTANGSGSATFSSDENDGGMLRQRTSQGTYSLDSSGQKSGRIALSGFSGPFASPPVLYLFAPNSAFVVGTDAKVSSGVLGPQSGAPFSNVLVSGLYPGGTDLPVLSVVTDSVTSLFGDAGGHVIATQYTSGPGGPGGPNNLTLSYQVDSTGRAVVQDQDGNEFGVLYVAGPNKFVLVPSGNTPGLTVFAPGGD